MSIAHKVSDEEFTIPCYIKLSEDQHLHLHLHTSTDTSPPMSSSTSPGRLRYPTSTRYWSDHQPIRVDVAIQCPDITLPLPAKVHRGSLAILRPTVLRPLSETIREIPQVDPAPTENIQLSPEQQKVLSVVKSGQNVFFTGPAGKLRLHFANIST